MDSAKFIPISLIDPNPHQPRRNHSFDDISELAASIQNNGIIEPLVVCPKGDRFALIAGYRRLTASRKAGLSEVPCIIREGTESELLELALLENIQRSDLTYIEEAESYKLLMKVAGINQAVVATKMHKSPGTISERLALLTLPEDLKVQVATRQLSIKAALEIGKINDSKRRSRLIIKADQQSLDDLKATVAKILDKQKRGRKQYEKRVAHPEFKELFVGLPVKRVYKDQVTFVFKTEDELIAALKKIIDRYESENREE